MEVFTHISEIKNFLHIQRVIGREIGFVPTMGALHQGHVSLVTESKKKELLTVVSIFVNPTQFGVNEDFSKYPRTTEHDMTLLTEAGCDVLFLPAVEEMYPVNNNLSMDIPSLTQDFEAVHRPGHFNGVMLVVAKLFNIVRPDMAFFGQKDFQQVAVVKRMVQELSFGIEVVACETVRESDGLAMSSRNRYLNEEERKKAAGIYQTLKYVKDLVKHEKSVENILRQAHTFINKYGFNQIDYLNIVHKDTLQPITLASPENYPILLVTVRCGTTRLLDNMILCD